MELLQTLKDEEYKKLLDEIYEEKDGSIKCKFVVKLDEDPSINPVMLSEKIASIQSLKDRLVTIYNQSISNKSYWEYAVKKIEYKLESEKQKALLEETVKSAKNSELREAMALDIAKNKIMEEIFDNKGNFDDHYLKIKKEYTKALSFYNNIKNIYDNLESASTMVAVQVKSVMIGLRLNSPSTELANTFRIEE